MPGRYGRQCYYVWQVYMTSTQLDISAGWDRSADGAMLIDLTSMQQICQPTAACSCLSNMVRELQSKQRAFASPTAHGETNGPMLLQEMAVYEQYILGMLTNFTAGLPLERIHNMLKMYVAEPAYDKSADQLGAFLNQLVADDKLSMSNDVYTKRAQW